MKLTGYIKIDNGLGVTPSCLSKIFDIRIKEISGIIKTPVVPEVPVKRVEKIWYSLVQPESDILFNESIDWGDAYDSGLALINYFLLEFDYYNNDQLDSIRQALSEDLLNWMDRFREVLFAFGYNVDHPSTIDFIDINSQCGIFYKTEDSLNPIRAINLKNPTIELTLRTAAELETLEKAIVAASDNKQLSLEYSFLKEAELSLIHKNYRKSLLDVATSLEICLGNFLKESLNVPASMMKELLKNYNSISKRRKLIDSMGLTLPDHNYQRDLEEVRNRAIHSGRTPTNQEASLAIKIVRDVLEKLNTSKLQ